MTAGCKPAVVKRVILKVETHQSEQQRLIVTNQTQKPLTLLPSNNAEVSRRLLPSEQATIAFRIVTLSELEESKHGWYKQSEVGRINLVISSEPVRFIKMSGLYAELYVKPENESRWTFKFDLQDCPEPGWVGGPSKTIDHQLEITGPPIEGIPINLCPPINND